MMRSHRTLSLAIFACLLPATLLPLRPARAQEAPAPAPAPTAEQPAAAPAAAPAAEDKDLRQSVEDFWHYGKIARYDMAASEGQKILAKSDQPVAVLEAFEAVA